MARRPGDPTAGPHRPAAPPDRAGRAKVSDVSPRIRRSGIAALAVLGVVVLLVAAWAIDTALHSGGAMRNVSVADRGVGGLSRSDLSSVVREVAESQESRPVSIATPAGTLETTAVAVGLEVDEEATRASAEQRGRDQFLLVRPFAWFGTLFSDHEVDVVYRVDRTVMASETSELVTNNLVEPKEPAILVADGEIVATPGEPGSGVSGDQLVDALVSAAREHADPTTPLAVSVEPQPISPRFSDADALRVATEARDMADGGLTVAVGSESAVIPAETLQTWMRAVPSPDGNQLVVGIDPVPIETDLTAAVGAVGEPPVELSWTVLPDGSVAYVTGTNGTKCCAPDSPQRVVDALRSGTGQVSLDLTVATPQHDPAWAEQMNIRQPIASFTTPHACCESRVRNIQRMAEIVRGTVVAPGETFSLNGHVGQRTTAKGFAEAGVIYNGRFTTDVGGGVSQFSTTLFNAAFFGGLEFVEYQAHTIYISRYPYGREATLSYPEPDLKITNISPFGILIWPTYTGTSITVTLYSSPWVIGEQTGQREERAGRCTRVITERTRTWLIDGRRELDTVSASYQPAEGVLC